MSLSSPTIPPRVRLPVAIEAIAATTPRFLDAENLFNAWCDGTPKINDFLHVSWTSLLDSLTKTLLENPRFATRLPLDELLLATTKGDIASLETWMITPQGDPPSPAADARLLGRRFGCDINAHAVSTACSSGLTALADAAIRLSSGIGTRACVIGADIITPFVRQGFTALKALSPRGRCLPFDRHRDGLTLGSAAAAVLLAPATRESHIHLAGWGMANDATHMTAPDREAKGLCRAIETALAVANLTAKDIDVIIAHATGTRYNDAMEIVAINRLFTDCGASPLVTATKGLIGHTLGASGVIEVAMGAKILEQQRIPPAVGLESPEDAAIRFVRQTTKAPVRHVLKIASGFGGMNAAVVLSRGAS